MQEEQSEYLGDPIRYGLFPVSLRRPPLFDEVLFDLFNANRGLLLELAEFGVLTLDAELRLMDQPLLQSAELAARLIECLLAKVFECEFVEGDASEGWRAEDEVRLAAEDDHEAPNVEFATHVESWCFQVPLDDDSFEDSDFLATFLVFGRGSLLRR